jgi:UDP-2,4-diacetamido-2,4,6-trideoxy-beta-L-altropyranose hydrolase
MHVVFRLDASRTVGLGHLSRTSNLALALEALGARSTFVVGGEGGASHARTRLPAHVPVHSIEASGSRADLETTAAVAEQAGASWVLVDHYELDSAYLAALREKVERLVVLDDLGDRELTMADLVVSSTPAAAMVAYPRELAPKLLRGDFVLLHPAFAEHRKGAPKSAGRPRRVLVSFGGTDAAALLPEALRTLRERWPEAELRAVLGIAERTDPPAHGEVRLYAQSPEAMAAHMAWADLAVATPSTISWELAAVGTPAILCRVVGNQNPTARYFRELGAFPVLDALAGLGEALADVERYPLDDLVMRWDRFASCCDGRGASRLARRLMGDLR